MIDKPFLEQQLKSLQEQYSNLLRNAEQTLGALLMTQALLKKADDDAAGEKSPAVVSASED